MNLTGIHQKNQTTKINNNLTDYIFSYIICAICLFGFLQSILNLLIFSRPKMYRISVNKYFLAKSIAEIFLLSIGFFRPFGYCIDCSNLKEKFSIIIYRAYFYEFIMYMVYYFLALINDRLRLFYKNRKIIIDNKFLIVFILILSIGPFIPIIYSFRIEKDHSNNSNIKYSKVMTEFGNSYSYHVYTGIIQIIYNTINLRAKIV